MRVIQPILDYYYWILRWHSAVVMMTNDWTLRSSFELRKQTTQAKKRRKEDDRSEILSPSHLEDIMLNSERYGCFFSADPKKVGRENRA